ncbi:MAG: phage terminase large subunit [Terriglobales bacterium]
MSDRAAILEQRRLVGSLQEFAKAAWHVLEPEVPLSWSFHHDLLCEHLELIARGEFRKKFKRLLRASRDTLISNSPPRDGKSTMVSVLFPVWCWLSRPGLRFLCASYNDRLAVGLSIKRRTLIRSRWFQQRFGSFFKLADDLDRADHFGNDAHGYMIATSPEGLGTGVGGDILIGDDLISAEDSYSGTIRSQVNRWLDTTWRTRLNNPSTGVFVYVSQRLHEDDPAGHLLATNASRCVHLKVPLEAEEEERWTFPTSGRVHIRPAGDVIEADRFTPEVVATLKLHPQSWAGQYQQRPAPSEGAIIKRNSIQFWRALPTFDELLQSWDCTFKDTSKSDFVSGQVWGRAGANFYLLDRVHDRLDFPATLSAIRSLTAKWPEAIAILIEDKANGPAVISTLKNELSGLIAVDPQGGKESRLRAVSALFEAKNIFVPDPTIAPWVHDVIEEWAAFPFARHDDDVDSMSQALLRLRLRGGEHGLIAYLKSGQAERDLEQMARPLPASRPGDGNALAALPTPAPKPAITCPRCSSERVTRVSGAVTRCLGCGEMFDAPSKFQIERPPSRTNGRWIQ